MSIPRHFNQRPRRRMAPPPRRVGNPTVSVEVETPVVETPVVEEVVVEIPVVEIPVVEIPVVEEVDTAEVEVVPPAEESAPEWNQGMRKAELLAVAEGLGLAVTDDNTKAEIIAALRAV